MNIGLVRHFKVNCDVNTFMTSNDFEEWVKKYDNSDVIENKFEVLENINWNKCFSSDLLRAIKTAKTIFKGEIIESRLLREVPMSSIFKTNLKLPYVFWCITSRLAWILKHKSQSESKVDTERRVNAFLNSIDKYSNDNILIVCHGFYMHTFQKELKRRGFSGKSVKRPRNGTLYLYKN